MILRLVIKSLMLVTLVASAAFADGYRLGPGDKLQLEVRAGASGEIEKELSGPVVLSDKGVLVEGWFGPLDLNGLTLEQAQDRVQNLLTKYFINPRLKLLLVESNGLIIVVTGAVNKIGNYPYREGYTALGAILDAGGFTKFANPNKSKIRRLDNGHEKVFEVRLGDVVNRGEKDKDFPLKPGDVINVPEGLL